jgi:hypothetical protein
MKNKISKLPKNESSSEKPTIRPFLKLIEEFGQRKNTHDVFGIILYTELDAHVINVLTNDTYWAALGKLSGDRLVIFSIRSHQGSNTINFGGGGPPGSMSMMVMMKDWKEPKENEKLLSFLDIHSTEDFPLLMIFTKVGNDQILRTIVKIQGKNDAECYECIFAAVKIITASISRVKEEYIKNNFEVFNLIDDALKQSILFKRFKKGVKFALIIKKLLSFFGI